MIKLFPRIYILNISTVQITFIKISLPNIHVYAGLQAFIPPKAVRYSLLLILLK